MPIRSHRVSAQPFINLRELLNWVAHDVFDLSEHALLQACGWAFEAHGDVEPFMAASASIERLEQDAMPDIRRALVGGELIAEGRLSTSRSGPRRSTSEWHLQEWHGYAGEWTVIPPQRWHGAAAVDWDMSRLRWLEGEYVEIRLNRDEALRVWPSSAAAPGREPDKDVSLTPDLSAATTDLARTKPPKKGRPAQHDYSKVDDILKSLLRDRGAKFLREEKREVLKHLRHELGREGLPAESTLRNHIDAFLESQTERQASSP